MTQLAEAVRSVLKTEARKGQTTKNSATILVLKRIENAGGPTKFGIGAAAMRMALAHIVSVEITRQFKTPLSDHAIDYILPKTAPAEIVAAFGKIPEWIAIEEGIDALWMFSLKARSEHWGANASLKEKKAAQTIAKANISLDMQRLLITYGFKSLEQMFRERSR
jgi:hypothetical protein